MGVLKHLGTADEEKRAFPIGDALHSRRDLAALLVLLELDHRKRTAKKKTQGLRSGEPITGFAGDDEALLRYVAPTPLVGPSPIARRDEDLMVKPLSRFLGWIEDEAVSPPSST